MTDDRGIRLQWNPGEQAFWFDAGTVCLELLTTGAELPWGHYEALHTPADVAEWAERSRLHVEAVDASDADIATLRGLRDSLWNVTKAVIAHQEPAREDLAAINETATSAPMAPQANPGLERSWHVPVTGQQLASTIARDAVELFTGPFADRVRTCESSNCELIFVDTSRPGRRRWCSMQRCGNRQKIRDFRDRQRGEGDHA